MRKTAMAVALILTTGLLAVLVAGEGRLGIPPQVPQSDKAKVAELRTRAERGDAEAEYDLGVMYAFGRGVAQDAVQAVMWWRNAAEKGHAKAQYDLGVAYDKGDGVPQDTSQAVAWLGKAAEHGHANAQYSLGLMYADGRGVPQDDAQAAAWYREGAEQGLTRAQHELGIIYSHGHGAPKDYVESYKWLSLAVARSSAEDERRELYVNTLDLVARWMTPGQVAEAQKRARAWTEAFERRQKK